MEFVRVGIIGVGGMGSAHLRNIKKLEGITVTALCDLDPKKIESFEGKRYTDSHQLITSKEVDAVLIATPHYAHTPISIDALSHGLHVLVEKPIAVHVNDAKKMIAAHTNPQQVFSTMFNQRTDPAYIRMKEIVSSGQLGEVRRTNWIITDWFRTAAYYASGGWRATWKGEGGGALINQCPHNLDLFQWIAGMPSRVTAKVSFGRYHSIEVEDDVTAMLEYPNGATGVFITSTGEAPGTNRLEVTGELGKLVYEAGKLIWTRNAVAMSEFNRTSTSGFAAPENKVEVMTFDQHGEQHTGIVKNFRDAILKGVPLLAPAAEGIRGLELGNAILLSGILGRAVALPLDGDQVEAEFKKLIASSKFQKGAVVQTTDDINGSWKK